MKPRWCLPPLTLKKLAWQHLLNEEKNKTERCSMLGADSDFTLLTHASGQHDQRKKNYTHTLAANAFFEARHMNFPI